MEKYISYSPEETQNIAAAFAQNLRRGDVVALYGGLGAGKTAFVKGVTRALGCTDEVSSPTFTLVNEYLGQLPVYHFDVYRLEQLSQSDSEWIDEYLFGDGVCLVEWAENIRSLLPEGTIRVELRKDFEKGENYREIIIC